jgi:hypothetical protein
MMRALCIIWRWLKFELTEGRVMYKPGFTWGPNRKMFRKSLYK